MRVRDILFEFKNLKKNQKIKKFELSYENFRKKC